MNYKIELTTEEIQIVLDSVLIQDSYNDTNTPAVDELMYKILDAKRSDGVTYGSTIL